jgi:hypothetical protein
MRHDAVLITNMALLAGVLLLGQLAKTFPRNGRRAGSGQ